MGRNTICETRFSDRSIHLIWCIMCLVTTKLWYVMVRNSFGKSTVCIVCRLYILHWCGKIFECFQCVVFKGLSCFTSIADKVLWKPRPVSRRYTKFPLSQSFGLFYSLPTGLQIRRKVLSILDSIDLSLDVPGKLELEVIDNAMAEQVIGGCETRNEQGLPICDLKLLHRILTAELNNLQGSSVLGQRSRLEEASLSYGDTLW